MVTLYKLCAVQWKVCDTEEAHHQYGCGCAVRICHTMSTVEVCSTDQSHYKYNRTTRTVQGGRWWLSLSSKMIFYRQSYYNPDFSLLWLDPESLRSF